VTLPNALSSPGVRRGVRQGIAFACRRAHGPLTFPAIPKRLPSYRIRGSRASRVTRQARDELPAFDRDVPATNCGAADDRCRRARNGRASMRDSLAATPQRSHLLGRALLYLVARPPQISPEQRDACGASEIFSRPIWNRPTTAIACERFAIQSLGPRIDAWISRSGPASRWPNFRAGRPATSAL